MNKSYKTTVTLRKKPLSKGRQALILDYYIANTEYDNSKPKGKRIRQHLGLYLVPETTPDAILANKEAWTKASNIVLAKRKEISEQDDKGVSPAKFYNVIKTKQDHLEKLTTLSVKLRKRHLQNGNDSLYLDINLGDYEFEYQGKVRSGRTKIYLHLYLQPRKNVELALENQETVSKAKIELIKTIKAIEGLIRDKKLRAICRSNLSELEFEFENYLPVANEHPYLPNIETLSKAINKLNALLEE